MVADVSALIAPAPVVAVSETPAPPSEPRHHFYAAAFVGSGFGDISHDLGVSVGGRLGYAGSSNVRGTIGAVVSYHFGSSISGYEPAVRASFEVSARRLLVGVEVGVEPIWKALHVRPYAVVGALLTTIECSGAPCALVPASRFATDTIFAAGLGLDVLAAVGPVFFGAEARALLSAPSHADPALFPSVNGVFGVTIP